MPRSRKPCCNLRLDSAFSTVEELRSMRAASVVAGLFHKPGSMGLSNCRCACGWPGRAHPLRYPGRIMGRLPRSVAAALARRLAECAPRVARLGFLQRRHWPCSCIATTLIRLLAPALRRAWPALLTGERACSASGSVVPFTWLSGCAVPAASTPATRGRQAAFFQPFCHSFRVNGSIP